MSGTWEYREDLEWKRGDLIWQARLPGGECLILEIWDTWEEYKKQLNERLPDAGDPIWNDYDFPVVRVLHPSEGLIEDPSYYYEDMEKAMKRGVATIEGRRDVKNHNG